MPIFKLNLQKEIDVDYQGVTLSEFTFSNDEQLSENELFDFFIHSSSFTEESRSEQIKNHKGDIPFLRQAFEIANISIGDFRELDKNNIIKFLNDYSEQDGWGDTDGDDFIILKNKFIDLVKSVHSDKFYLISKDWFDEKDKRLREPESWIYSYYFLILWLDNLNKTLTVSEWTYD